MAFLCLETQQEEKEKTMAWSVTRHPPVPLPGAYKRLLAGFESLTLGLYVSWDKEWDSLHSALQSMKERAVGKDAIVDKTPSGRKFLHFPTGKAPNYRYHLKFPEYHIYIGITHPPKNSPNVLVSISAEALWLKGVDQSIKQVIEDLAEFNGEILKTQVSRCDLCADFALPEPLTLDFLKAWKVSLTGKNNWYDNRDVLETFYAGKKGAPIQMRIYDKGREITQNGGKYWFLNLWNLKKAKHVWRVEFQLLRPALKDLKVDTIEDLWEQSGGIWAYLTSRWFSLRDPTQTRQNRRKFHPWWELVHETAKDLGEVRQIVRLDRDDILPTSGWYIEHVGGMLPSYAARQGIRDTHDAAMELARTLICYWYERDFYGEYDKRLLRLGFSAFIKSMEGENEKSA